MEKNKLNLGIGITGSFCTFSKLKDTLIELKNNDYNLIPIMSYNAYNTDTRFGIAKEHINDIEKICEKEILKTITDVEPIGPKHLLDVLLILPCTGNTIAKLANGISDTPITSAVKSQLRNNRPVVLAMTTNDGLSTNAMNIGKLLNTKNIYVVPFKQDNPVEKPNSISYIEARINDTIFNAINNVQIQPILDNE